MCHFCFSRRPLRFKLTKQKKKKNSLNAEGRCSDFIVDKEPFVLSYE